MLAYDKSSRTYDADGHLHVEMCNISKANVCPYFGHEIPGHEALGLDPSRIYNLYRDPEELRRAADSFANKPLLLHHIPVSADAPARELIVGVIGGPAVFEHPYLRAPVSVWTRDGIDAIETHEQEELSSSYRYRAEMTSGTSPEGVAYDGRMCDIIGNHVALVKEGRAGPDVIVADSKPTVKIFQTMKHSKILAAIAAVLGLKPADVPALDAALDAVAKEDMDEKAACDAAEAAAKKKKEDEEAALDSEDPTTLPTMDAKIKLAEDAAVAKIHALYAAREAVAPKVGAVALDSAEAVYRFAMDQAKIEHTAVAADGLGALWTAAQKTALDVTPPPAVAFDMLKLFPGFSQIRKG